MPTMRPPSITLLLTFSRPLSTTPMHLAKDISRKPRPKNPQNPPSPPPYPYGISQIYKQRNRGLYGTSMLRSGNIISKKNEIKTRRVWRPNIHSRRLWSEALDRFVRIRVQARVLRTIDKVGGLDEYLLGDKPGRVKELGPGGWALRWRLLGTEKVRERYRAERRRLGLPEEGLMGGLNLGREGAMISKEQLEGEIEAFDEELDEVERRAVEEGEDGEAGMVVGEGEHERDFLEEEEVREQPRERV